MHPISQAILTIIKATPDYSLEQLQLDLREESSVVEEKLLRRQDVAKLFSVSTRTVDRWVQIFPHIAIKLGDPTTKSTPRRIYIDRLRKALGMDH